MGGMQSIEVFVAGENEGLGNGGGRGNPEIVLGDSSEGIQENGGHPSEPNEPPRLYQEGSALGEPSRDRPKHDLDLIVSLISRPMPDDRIEPRTGPLDLMQ